MDRRVFMRASAVGAGGLWLTSSLACRVGAGSAGFVPPYEANDDLFVFDAKRAAYRLDPYGHRVQALDARGEVTAEWGEVGTAPGQLNYPIDAEIGPDGRLYVLEPGNARVQVFDSRGRLSGEIGGREVLLHPRDLAFDTKGALYVCDLGLHVVRVFDTGGTHLRDIADRGGPDIEGGSGLNGPRGLTVTPDGELHVVDVGNARVQVYDTQGAYGRAYGGYGTKPGQLLQPSSIAADDTGRTYVADPTAGFVHVFGSKGKFLGRFHPSTADGVTVVPMRVRTFAGRRLHVWAAGHRLA